MDDHEVTESQIDESVARAFRHEPASSAELFRRAGFCEEDAARGARLLESGKYFSFTDVATSMGVFEGDAFRRRNPNVTAERIAEAAEQAARQRPVAEADFDDAVLGKRVEGRR